MSTVMMPGVKEQVDVDEVTNQTPTWSLICMNDEVHPFDLVILGLLRIKLTQDDAIAKTLEIHHEGSAVVKSGLTKDDALIDRHIIVDTTKAGQRFPGIEVQIIEDLG